MDFELAPWRFMIIKFVMSDIPVTFMKYQDIALHVLAKSYSTVTAVRSTMYFKGTFFHRTVRHCFFVLISVKRTR